MQNSNYEKIKLLFVEDDEITRQNAVEYLENFFDDIYEASDALSALRLYEEIKPDIIITDIQMPKLNGLEFVRKIRQKDKKVQVIVISAFSNKEYLFEAIELQLVKYLVKPVDEKSLKESLDMCIEAIKNDSSNIVNLKDGYRFDTFNKTLFFKEEQVKLRAKEIEFLTLLIKNKNRYVTYNEIENFVWQDSVMTKDALKTVVKNLKSKVPKELISNLWGTGYKIDV